MDQTTKELINMLSLNVLLRLKKQCEAYTTYTIDYKQINRKNSIVDRQKVFAEILEQVNATLVFKQLEFEKIKEEDIQKKSDNVQSTMEENKNNAPIAQSENINNYNNKATKTKSKEKS